MKNLLFGTLTAIPILFLLSSDVQKTRYQRDYVENLHGMPVKFGTYVFDVEYRNAENWNSYEYFISCKHSKIKPRFPFLKYDRRTDFLGRFNIHTGKMESAMLGKDTGKIPTLFMYQPSCEEKIAMNF